ncbi:MAG: CsbD family protein [Nakamurella sp.]
MTSEHKGEELKGRAKEAAGALTGDSDLKHEGQFDQAAAKTKRGVDHAADKIHDAIDNVTQRNDKS